MWSGGARVKFDLTKPGTPIDRAKLLSLVVGSRRHRTRVEEGRSHPETGLPFKATTDELGNTVTEHGRAGSAVSERQDATMRPQTVKGKL
jgi:hypothetical protein